MNAAERRDFFPPSFTELALDWSLSDPKNLSPNSSLARKGFSNGVKLEVHSGRSAFVDWGSAPLSPQDKDWLRYGWASAIAALQDGFLVLHGSSVIVQGKAITIMGESGAGKSSTIVKLLHRGHQILVDDVSVVDVAPAVSANEPPLLIPFRRPVTVTAEALDLLDISPQDWFQMRANPNKGALEFPIEDVNPVRLDGIIVLEPRHSEDHLGFDVPGRLTSFDLLVEHSSREGMASAILGHEVLQSYVSHMVRSVPVGRVARQVGVNSLEVVAAVVEDFALQL